MTSEATMRSAARIQYVTLGLLVGLAGRASGQAKPAATPNVAGIARPSRSDSLYSSLERDFTVGKTVYLRSSKTRIGVIRATDSNHAFPPKFFPASRMKAVLIRHTDGPFDWMPLERAVRIYVVKKP
jgi:hypothetical protein